MLVGLCRDADYDVFGMPVGERLQVLCVPGVVRRLEQARNLSRTSTLAASEIGLAYALRCVLPRARRIAGVSQGGGRIPAPALREPGR